MVTEEDLAKLKEKARTDLRNFSNRMMDFDAIGSAPLLELLHDELAYVENVSNNALTTQVCTAMWFQNIRYNFLTHVLGKPRSLDLRKDYAVGDAPCICVGGGPSITDEQLEELANFKGKVFCCNKTYPRLVKYRNPDFVTIIHGTPEIVQAFSEEATQLAMRESQTVFIVATCVDKGVGDILAANVPPERLVWFNASIPDMFMENIDMMMTLFTDLPNIDTGGNVGVFSLIMATELGAKEVAILGMEHCFDLDPKWKNVDTLDYTISYFPEDNQLYAMTPVFRGYYEVLLRWLSQVKGNIKVVNLTPKGPLYVDRRAFGVPCVSVKEYVSGHASL